MRSAGLADDRREDHAPPDGTAMIAEPDVGSAPAPVPYVSNYSRYSDRPMDWRTRLFGIGGTTTIIAVVLGCALFTWRVVQPMIAPSMPVVVNLQSFEAPPEPVREVAEGPEQVQQEEQKPKEQERPDPLPEILVPRLSPLTQPVPPPVEHAPATERVPETTAPRTIAAPPSNRVSSNSDATWEALVLAHLQKYRRYPARARAARQQGVVHVTFRVNRAGEVLSASIHRGSGSYTLDQAALDTIRRAQPLPAIPDDRPDVIELTLPVEFFVR
jgi:protein TonB